MTALTLAIPQSVRVKSTSSLPCLRRDLHIHEGPCRHDGSPTWTLEDPVRGQYIRIGWAEMEMLRRWSLGNAESIANEVSQTTTLILGKQDVLTFANSLHSFQLTEPKNEQDTERLLQIAINRKANWLSWLLHNYLFLRIPLFRPDHFLELTLPLVRPLASRTFLFLTVIAALLGLSLVARQFDTFLHTFLYFFTLEGAIMAAITLIFVKLIHELGHAYVSKYYGCRVPTMGIAFLVLWPVLYTDTTDAWRLVKRRQRMAIGMAGMLSELAVAAWATLLWNFLPDGLFRSAAFTLATTTWILTLAINLLPLMRFDGYFLFSDFIGVPNLQQRGFALGRWRIRELVFGTGEPPPERFHPWLHSGVLIYAYATWIYRFFLFLGIALLVYHFAIKIVGIVLFTIEIVYFILLPVIRELKLWWSHRRDMAFNKNILVSGALLIAGFMLFIFPWSNRVDAPALLHAKQQVNLFMPVGGQLTQIPETGNQAVMQGTLLFHIDAPEQKLALEQIDTEISVLREQSRYQERNGRDAARQHIARQSLEVALRRRSALVEQLKALRIVAPFNGRLVDMASPLEQGEWLPKGEWLATLIGPVGSQIEAFVAEENLERLHLGAKAWFIPEELGLERQEFRVVDIAQTATRRLDAFPELTSPFSGKIAAYTERNNRLLPASAVYRVLLTSIKPNQSLPQVLRGTISIEVERESLLMQIWRRALTFLIRETGF